LSELGVASRVILSPLARTTPRTRVEIKASPFSITALSEQYTITITTARKWKHCDDVQDRSHRPLNRNTTLTPAQEALSEAGRADENPEGAYR